MGAEVAGFPMNITSGIHHRDQRNETAFDVIHAICLIARFQAISCTGTSSQAVSVITCMLYDLDMENGSRVCRN